MSSGQGADFRALVSKHTSVVFCVAQCVIESASYNRISELDALGTDTRERARDQDQLTGGQLVMEIDGQRGDDAAETA